MKVQKMILAAVLIVMLPLAVFAGGGSQNRAASEEVTTVNGRQMINNTFLSGLPIVNQPLTL